MSKFFSSRELTDDEMFEDLRKHYAAATRIIFCEFNYCIYNNGKKCTLSDTSISAAGFCNECIIPDIDNETLEKYKQATRARL